MNPLPKTLQSRINRLAHRQALKHEQRIKSDLTQQLQQARIEGASFDDLTRTLDVLETAKPDGEAKQRASDLKRVASILRGLFAF